MTIANLKKEIQELTIRLSYSKTKAAYVWMLYCAARLNEAYQEFVSKNKL